MPLLHYWILQCSVCFLSANIIDWHKWYKSTNLRDLNTIIDGRTSELVTQSKREQFIMGFKDKASIFSNGKSITADWYELISFCSFMNKHHVLAPVSVSMMLVYVAVSTFWMSLAAPPSLDPSIHLHRFWHIIGSLCRVQEALGDKEKGQRARLRDPSDST